MKPTDRIARSISELTAASMAWPSFAAAIRARTHDGYRSTTGGGTSGGEIPNPTHNAVISRQRWVELWEEAEGLTAEALGISSRLAYITHQLKQPDPPSVLRCHGNPDKPWARPDCTNNAVRNGECWTCVKRGQRWLEDEVVV